MLKEVYRALELMEEDINKALSRLIQIRRSVSSGVASKAEILRQLTLLEEELKR